MSKRAQIGMSMFLISEAVFFFMLILAFRYFAEIRFASPRNAWVLALLLFAGSISVRRAWRWVTIGLGAAFLIGLFVTGSSVLTSIHGLHILAGMIALALVPVSALRALALYWYFFTAVWLVIVLVANFSGAVA
jgi:heme/copper-type cytochrome/quinol oxidase subunit 3